MSEMSYAQLLKKQAADALRKARELMNDCGAHWLQGDWNGVNDDGEMAYCAVGALRQITGGRDGDVLNLAVKTLGEEDAVRAAVQMAEMNVEETAEVDRVITWNDAEDRSWNEIAMIFQRAEERLRAGL